MSDELCRLGGEGAILRQYPGIRSDELNATCHTRMWS